MVELSYLIKNNCFFICMLFTSCLHLSNINQLTITIMISLDISFFNECAYCTCCVESDNFSISKELYPECENTFKYVAKCNSFNVIISADNTQTEVKAICDYVSENWANILNKFELEYESKNF